MAYYNFKYPYALSESQPSLMGGITVPSQPQPNLPTSVTPTTPQPQQTPNPMGDGKNDRLALMLYALGGALKGNKNFVQNTLALQQMQEGKKKQEEQKKNYQEFLKTIDPDSPFYDLAKSIGQEGLPKLLLERYKAETTIPKDLTPTEQKARILAKVQAGKPLSKEDRDILDILQRTDPIEIAMRGALGTPNIEADTSIPQNFKGTAEQWNVLKQANPSVSDTDLINYFNTQYGS